MAGTSVISGNFTNFLAGFPPLGPTVNRSPAQRKWTGGKPSTWKKQHHCVGRQPTLLKIPLGLLIVSNNSSFSLFPKISLALAVMTKIISRRLVENQLLFNFRLDAFLIWICYLNLSIKNVYKWWSIFIGPFWPPLHLPFWMNLTFYWPMV